MASIQKLKFGLSPVRPLDDLSTVEENWLEWKNNVQGQLLFLFAKVFNVSHNINYAIIWGDPAVQFPNGSWRGAIGQLLRGDYDFSLQTVLRSEENSKAVHFSYPLMLYGASFVTKKPQYLPNIFDIVQKFSALVWITLLITFVALIAVYFVIFRQYDFQKILFHVLAVLLGHSAIITPKGIAKNLLIYSWVVGAMFLCLAYDSVILSFFAFPPKTGVKDMSDLAVAVKSGDYKCMSVAAYAWGAVLKNSQHQDLKVIGQNILENIESLGMYVPEFIREVKSRNVAYLFESQNVQMFSGTFFIFDIPFQFMGSMFVRHDFCCKEQLDMTVHRIMASGLYFKIIDDSAFLLRLKYLSNYTEPEISKILTLTNLAPAFIILLFGYTLSLIVLAIEIILSRIKKRVKKKRKRLRRELLALQEREKV